MRWFIAGAIVIGAVVARHSVLTRSSAKPCASLARVLAVAGATTTRSAQRASSIWPIAASAAASHSEVRTGAPTAPGRSARRRSAGVLGHRHLHLRAGVAQAPHQFGGLVRGDAAADAEQDALALQASADVGGACRPSAGKFPPRNGRLAYPKGRQWPAARPRGRRWNAWQIRRFARSPTPVRSAAEGAKPKGFDADAGRASCSFPLQALRNHAHPRLARRRTPPRKTPRPRRRHVCRMPNCWRSSSAPACAAATRSATARELLTAHGPLRALLERSPAQLAELPGLGPARACTLAAALELGHRHLAPNSNAARR